MTIGAMTIGVIVVGLLISGIIASLIGNARGRGPVDSFMFGAIFGIFGIAWVAIANDTPRGWKHVQCPRCNAKQNVPKDGGECWQCKTPLGIQTTRAKQS